MADVNPPPRPDTSAAGTEPEQAGLWSKEPVAILTIALVIVQALIAGFGIGELEDGFQAGDIVVFLSTVVMGIIARLNVFAPATVDQLATPPQQERAVARAKAR